MRNIRYVGLLSGLALGVLYACTVPDLQMNNMNQSGGDTLDLAGVDFAIEPGSIGSPCSDTTQCKAGLAPVCWKKNLLEDPGNLPVKNGYCSSTCASDNDCGGSGTCQTVVAGAQKYCLRSCVGPTACRSNEGQGCYILTPRSGYCYPTDRLSCNPTQIDPATKNGTCPGSVPESGCIRRTFEDIGECRELCTLVPGSCPVREGRPQHCVYLDATVDGKGAATRDTFKGLICFPLYGDARQPGESCSYFDECVDGYQCNLVATGDKKCHQLCIVGAMNVCDNGLTCKDAFKNGVGKPGLCL